MEYHKSFQLCSSELSILFLYILPSISDVECKQFAGGNQDGIKRPFSAAGRLYPTYPLPLEGPSMICESNPYKKRAVRQLLLVSTNRAKMRMEGSLN